MKLNTRIINIAILICFISQNVIGQGSYNILNKRTDLIEIPFTMHNGKPLLELKINGKEARLMIDNGVLWDPVWLFGIPLVEELQLKPIKEEEIEGAGKGDPMTAYESNSISLQFNDIVFSEQPVLVSPPSAGFNRMFPGVDGQLSNTFFKNFIVEFDFIKSKIILHKPESFNYVGDGCILKMTLTETGTHAIPFSLVMPNGKTYNDKVDIDFGGIHELKIALNDKNNIELPDDVKEAKGLRLKGISPEYKGKIKSMSIGKYIFNNPVVYYGDKTTSRVHPLNLGRIGLPLFMKFNVTFDYFNNKLYIDPNKNFDGKIVENNNSTNKDIEKVMIKKIIQTAYIEGLENEGDTVKIDLGFHPDFKLLGIGKNNSLWNYSIQKWKESSLKKKENGEFPLKGDQKVSAKFLWVDVDGNAAICKLAYYIGNKITYIDYISLYKFDNGWKMVSKIYDKQ